jgi:peptide/nickel transport system permease protein
MQAFVINRLIQTIIVIVVVSFLSYMIIYLIPGDPVAAMLGPDASPSAIQSLKKEMGLDQPLITQYSQWVWHSVQGNFGRSLLYQESVASLIASHLPVTLYIGVIALVITMIVGTTLGVICAVRRGSFLDQTITALANIGVATPVFWLGIMGIYLFAVKLSWLPVQGYISPTEDLISSLRYIVMPTLCLALVPLSGIARQTRSAMLEVINQDYIRTAWSKGLSEKVIVMRHALKNALIPVVTLLGIQARYVVGGSVLIETVFNIPGMGRLIVDSVFNKDFVVVQACILILAVVISLANLLVDISYGYIDPRLRYV